MEGRVVRFDYKRDPNRNKGNGSQLTDFVKGKKVSKRSFSLFITWLYTVMSTITSLSTR